MLFCLQVAKSVSLRLCNELEAVQKKNSQLERENEALREKTQELEVAKLVLQAEAEKTREVRLIRTFYLQTHRCPGEGGVYNKSLRAVNQTGILQRRPASCPPDVR